MLGDCRIPNCAVSYVFAENIKEKIEEVKRAMLAEFELERTHHQKLVKDYARLQQRFENLQGDMQV